MDTAALVLDAVVVIDVHRVGSAFDVDQDVGFDLLEVDEDQRRAITILIEKRKEVPMETADVRVVQLRVILDLVHEISIDVVLSAALHQNVIGEVALPQG